jgi:hypothetical protein
MRIGLRQLLQFLEILAWEHKELAELPGNFSLC